MRSLRRQQAERWTSWLITLELVGLSFVSHLSNLSIYTDIHTGYALPLLDNDIEVAKKMFDVNVFAVMALTQAFAPLLIEAKGTIINISSVAGCFPYPWHGYYSASKASLRLLTDQLRIELKPFGVNAINIVSGGIQTNFFDNQVATELPGTSLYAPWKKEVEWVANGGVVKGGWTPAEVYAQKVVKNALKSNPNVNYWVGDSTFTVWFMTTCLWHTVIVSIEACCGYP